MSESKKEEVSEEELIEKKSGKKLLIIIISALLLVLVIGGGAAFFMLSSDKAEVKGESAPKDIQTANDAPIDESLSEVGLLYPLETFTVNVLSDSERNYLKVEMTLEVTGKDLSPELDKDKPELRDIIIEILSSKTLEEISTEQGKEKLKKEIIIALNKHLKDTKVKNIYFTDFVEQ
ncbi:MAG: flagellar basal body-associated FliL family protein [Sulfuricurvum sp.]|nr:flagellar basal body-associated FliL family protein [Sulfuricurvum sp.]